MPVGSSLLLLKSKSLLVVAAIGFCLAEAGAAHAQSDFVGTRALGMGEALRANAAGAAAVILNPAGMSLSKGYVIEASYGLRVEDLGHHAFVGIVDSVTSRIAAGLWYEYIHAKPTIGFNWAGGFVPRSKLTREGHAAGLSLSMALGERFLLGVSVRYLHFNTDAPLPSGTVPSSLKLDNVNGITFDVGLLVRVLPKLQIALVGYNLWDHGSRETPTSLGFGLAFIPIPQLSIDFDGVANFTGYKKAVYDKMNPAVIAKFDTQVTGRFGPGIEWLVANKVPVRIGALYDTALTAAYLTGGVGYFSQSFAVDLSYRGKVSGGREDFLMLGLRIFIN